MFGRKGSLMGNYGAPAVPRSLSSGVSIAGAAPGLDNGGLLSELLRMELARSAGAQPPGLLGYGAPPSLLGGYISQPESGPAPVNFQSPQAGRQSQPVPVTSEPLPPVNDPVRELLGPLPSQQPPDLRGGRGLPLSGPPAGVPRLPGPTSGEIGSLPQVAGRAPGPDPMAPNIPKRSGWRILDSVLGGGMTISQARDAETARISGAERLQQQLAFASTLPPIEREIYMSNIKAWSDNKAANLKNVDLAGGHVLTTGDGRALAGAPIIEKFDDRFGFASPVTGQTMFTDPRGPTFDETSNDAERRSTADYQSGQLGVARGRLGLDTWQAHDSSERGWQGLDYEGQRIDQGSTDQYIASLARKQAAGEPLTEAEQASLETIKSARTSSEMDALMAGMGLGGGPVAPASAMPSPGRPPPLPASPRRPPAQPVPGAAGPKAGSAASAPARVSSQQQFDALPVGAWFVNPADGRVMRKAK